MHLEKPARGTESLRSQSHLRHKAAVAASLSVTAAGPLHAVRTVHDDRRHNLQHVADVAEVHHQVVIPHHVATLRQPHLFGAGLAGLLYRVPHVAATQELRLLDVHRPARPRCRCQQVRLTAQEGGYLYHVAHLTHSLSLPTFVDVRQQPQSVLLLHVGQHLQPTL